VIRRAVIFSGVARECRLEVSLRNTKRTLIVTLVCVFATSFSPLRIDAQQAVPQPSGKTKIILDTDIGDDVDDAFALALAMRSPEVEMVGITTAWGDTALRARLVQRFLKENGAAEIPIAVGIATKSTANFSQSRWAQDGSPFKRKLDAVDFLLEQARKAPGEITLVAIGPLTNVGAAIERDAATFKKFKRVVLMGGSIRKGYGDLGYAPDHGPQPEYNIYSDVAAAQKLFASGVPVFMMPLDSTQLMLDEVKRNILFSAGTAMTNSLAALYYQWVESNRTPTAMLFDVMAVVYVVQPELCPVTEFHITVDAQGFTRPGAGATNASACLASDSEKFFHFVLPRLTQSSRVAVNLRMSVTGTTNPGPSETSPTIGGSVSAFVAAFDNLDWPTFPARFSEKPTIFHPSAPNIRRIDTPGEFEKAWPGVFERIKKNSHRIVAPHMDLQPRDLRIEKLSLVTFHIEDRNVLDRRMPVMKRDSGEWKIAHIHASNLEAP
jgi:inosine-uridine nucleoside N-ribohydrolase